MSKLYKKLSVQFPNKLAVIGFRDEGHQPIFWRRRNVMSEHGIDFDDCANQGRSGYTIGAERLSKMSKMQEIITVLEMSHFRNFSKRVI